MARSSSSVSVVPDGPAAHAVVPFGQASDDRPRGVLVASLNPQVPVNDGFRLFLDVVSTTLGSALDNAVRRDRELGEHRAINETLQAAMITPITDTGTIAARYVAAADGLSVGGDWYDLVELGEHRRALIVGDCVGHGLQAATAMGQLRSASRAMLLEGRDPASVLEGLDLFAGSVEGAYCATVVCAIIDRRDRCDHLQPGRPPSTPRVRARRAPAGSTMGCRCRWPSSRASSAATPTRLDEPPRTSSCSTPTAWSSGGVRSSTPVCPGWPSTVERGDGETLAELADRLLREMLNEDSSDDVVVVVKCLHD